MTDNLEQELISRLKASSSPTGTLVSETSGPTADCVGLTFFTKNIILIEKFLKKHSFRDLTCLLVPEYNKDMAHRVRLNYYRASAKLDQLKLLLEFITNKSIPRGSSAEAIYNITKIEPEDIMKLLKGELRNASQVPSETCDVSEDTRVEGCKPEGCEPSEGCEPDEKAFLYKSKPKEDVKELFRKYRNEDNK